MATMSPPCQPWSTGGRHQGLSCANGWAFIDGLLFGFKLQVNMMAVECADNIVNHEHFAILTQIAKQLGYRLVWAQVTPLNHLAPQMRTRWLATCVRFDLDAKYYDGRITPHVIPRTRWTDQDFSFQVPRIWEEQLLLSDSEKEFYGDVNFLPPSKRGLFGGGGPVSQTQVLYARIPKEEEPLPTLCASYTAQHELDSSHLEAKGAFAFLCMQPKGFSFFDPALCVSLLGATEDCTLSAKIREAFHGLGNAIATPHALLPVMIGLLSVSQDPIDIHDMLQKCWHDRLTASNAIVCHTGNWVRIVHVSSIAKFLSSKDQANRNEHCIATAHIGNDGLCFDLHGSPNSTIGRLLRDAIRGPSEVLYAFMLIGSTQTVHLPCTAQEARSIQPRWNLSIQGVICGWVVFPDCSVPQDLSPTSVPHFQDSANQSTFHAVGQMDFDHTEGTVHEILLQPVSPTAHTAKGLAKGKGKGKNQKTKAEEHQASWAPPAQLVPTRSKQDEERLTRLETRFDQLEQRQVGFENRVESKFDHISDSLRQILAASHQRSREPTGETPPPKLPKQA